MAMAANDVVKQVERTPLFNFITGIWKGFTGQASQEAMNQQNIDYQQAFNQQVFDREDTYLQRRVEDARNAGFSPLAALDGASNYSTVASAPQNIVNGAGVVSPSEAMSAIGNLVANLKNANSNRISAESRKTSNEIQREFNQMYDSLERDKLNAQQTMLADKLKNTMDIAKEYTSAMKYSSENSYMASVYSANMSESIARVNAKMTKEIEEMREAFERQNFTEKQKQEYDIFTKQLENYNDNLQKSRSQSERQFWAGQIQKLCTDVFRTIFTSMYGGVTINRNYNNFYPDY